DDMALTALTVSDKDGVVRATFVLPPNLVRLVMTAKQIGHRMKPLTRGARTIGYRVDVDAKGARLGRECLGNCLRRAAGNGARRPTIEHAGRSRGYSMTWSARRTSDRGMVTPSAFAVFRLMTSSNFVGCSNGRSPGLAPFRILSTRVATRVESS